MGIFNRNKKESYNPIKKEKYVSAIFKNEPEKYGLRGDFYFWEYLAVYFKNKELPYSKKMILQDIYDIFEKLTNQKLEPNKIVKINQFSHGGMSSGEISTDWWIQTGIPLIMNQYDRLSNYMEKELKALAKKSVISIGIICTIGAIFLCSMIFIGIFAFSRVFYYIPMLYMVTLIILLSVLLLIKNLIYIKWSHFTYGKVTKIEKSSLNESQVYQNYIIEYIEGRTSKTYETNVYEQFGDNLEELKNEIQKFYEDGQRLIGKKVPILYKPNEPKKVYVFLKMAE